MQIESTELAIQRIRALLHVARTALQTLYREQAARQAAYEAQPRADLEAQPDPVNDYSAQQQRLAAERQAQLQRQAHAQEVSRVNAARAADLDLMRAEVARARRHLAVATTASVALGVTGAGISTTRSYVGRLAQRATNTPVTTAQAHALTERIRTLNTNTIRPDAASRAYQQQRQVAQHHRHADHLGHAVQHGQQIS